jgi:hypothetical protein
VSVDEEDYSTALSNQKRALQRVLLLKRLGMLTATVPAPQVCSEQLADDPTYCAAWNPDGVSFAGDPDFSEIILELADLPGASG